MGKEPGSSCRGTAALNEPKDPVISFRIGAALLRAGPDVDAMRPENSACRAMRKGFSYLRHPVSAAGLETTFAVWLARLILTADRLK